VTVLSHIATSKNWTINGQPVKDGLTLKAGEKLEILAHAQPVTEKSKISRTKWSSKGPWIPGYDEFDVWIRFAQETPWSAAESRSNIHGLMKRRPKKPDEPHYGKGVAPRRIGEYEVQIVAQKRKLGGFLVDQQIAGDVLEVAKVRVTPTGL